MLRELEVMKQYQINISNGSATLENLNDCEDINRDWESMKESIKPSAKYSICLHELKLHKPWLDEERLRSLDKRKQAKMQ